MQPKNLSVLQYSDYRLFLRDHLALIQDRNPKFSYASWAGRLGLKAPSAVAMIVKGQRNPGPNLTEIFVRDLKLVGREASFFRDLVWLEKCKGNKTQETLIMARLAELHPKKEFRQINLPAFHAISNWYFYVLRELVDLPGFREEPRWIQSRLRIPLTSKEIQEAIKTLVELGFLQRDRAGKLRYTQRVHTAFDVPDEGLKRYHEQILGFARESVRTVDPELREISGMTLTLRAADLPRAKQMLRQVQYDLAQLAKNPGDEVYQVEVALFPFTKPEIITQ